MKPAIAALPILAGLAWLVGCHRAPAANEKTPPAGEIWLTAEQIRGARLAIEPAAARTLSLHLTTAGRVAFDESRVAHVFPPVSGRVTKVIAALGQRVSKGDPLALIESPDLASAWSDLVKARADVVAAGREFDRQKSLYEHQASAEREFETAQDNSEKARAELARARLKMQTLHAPTDGPATQEFVLRSPIAGVVVNRAASPGLEVQGMLSAANVVSELYTVGRIDSVWVWGDLYERDLAKVHPGQEVAISAVAYPGRVVIGRVDYIAPALDPQTHTARLRCSVANSDGLFKPEMFVTLSIRVGTRSELSVPRTAVLKAADRQTVFVEDGDASDGRRRFLQRAVEIGDSSDGYVAIASGLSGGERVVVSGSILLSGGAE